MNEVSWAGVDLFNRPIMAVRGNDGSVVVRVMRVDGDGEDDEKANVISLNATSVAEFAEWVKMRGKA